MADSVISITNFSFNYPDGTAALKKINLDIKQGEFVAIMGPNGAGKSTLCLSINGSVPNITGGEMEGYVNVMGWDTAEHHTYDMASKVGTILQDPETQLFSTDVFSEIAFGPENLGMPKEEILERIKWATEVTRIQHLENRSPWSLSGGQKQRVAIASIMAMRPPILVLDEPTSQLDPIGTQEVFSVVKELNKKYNTTVVMAEHKTEMVAEYADRVILMNQGEVMADGPVDKILTENETLDKISVKVCEVSSLGCRLKSLGLTEKVPITLDDMTKVMLGLVERKKAKPKVAPKAGVANMKREGETPLLELRNLTHVYPGDIKALNNINLSIYKGDFVGLIGQNGAGKTTLIKHFIGLLKPTEGQFLLDGEDTVDMSTPELAKRIGVVLQNPDHQIFSQNVRDEVAFAPTIANLDEEEIEKRTNRAIHAMGLEDYQQEYPFSLSMGIRRKISVASMLSMEPETLIFDEPTTGQDYAGRYEIGEIAKTLNEKEGRTVIMITHDMDLIAKYAKRVVVFGQAQILLDGPTKDVFSDVDTLSKTYLQPPQMTMLANRLASHGFRRDVLTVDDFLNSVDFVR